MKALQVVDVFREGHLVVPIYLLKNYKKFKVSLDEFIFLMYLYQLGDHSLFNPSKYQEELGMDLAQVMKYIETLTDRKLIQVEVVKNEKGLMEEVVMLDGFFGKISSIFIENSN